MYTNPYDDRQQRRAQRRYERDARRYYRYQNPMRGLAGGLILIALIIGFALNPFWGANGFLVIFFIGLALASLFGSLSTMHRYGVYGGFYGFIWLLGLALCFAIGFWPWILLPVAVSMILSAMYRPIMGGLAGTGFVAGVSMQQPYQQPNQQPYPEPEQANYQQGYQGAPPQPHETYRENAQPADQPQVQYPEQQQEQPPMELPPMEQG